MKKKWCILTAILVVAIIFVGIYPIFFKEKSDKSSNNILKIYLLGSEDSYDYRIQFIINEFEKRYPDMKIQKVMFNPNSGDGIEGYVKRILTDTLSGEGPDILLLDNMSTRKLEKSRMLVDLKPLLEKDSDFNEEDYNMPVINAGIYEGKQVVMPLDYYVNQYITTKELLDSKNIVLDKVENQNDFINAIDTYISSLNNEKNKYLFGAPINIEDFLASSGEKFINYDDKEVYFNKPEFKEIIDNYKKIYNVSKKLSDMVGVSGVDGFEGLRKGNVLFSNDPISMRDTFFEYESLINQAIKETQVIDTIPTYKGGDKVVPIVGSSLAISDNTKNVEAAYNFIKIAISEDIQKCKDIPQCIPVNKKAARDLEDFYSKEIVNTSYDFDKNLIITNKPLSDGFKNYYNKILDNLEEGQITNLDVKNMLMENLLPYFEGKSSYESCINTLTNKVKIYINE